MDAAGAELVAAVAAVGHAALFLLQLLRQVGLPTFAVAATRSSHAAVAALLRTGIVVTCSLASVGSSASTTRNHNSEMNSRSMTC